MKYSVLLLFMFTANPVLACGPGSDQTGCNPEPPTKPPVVVVNKEDPDNEPWVVTPLPIYMPGCKFEGKIWAHPPLGLVSFEKTKAYLLSVVDLIPDCKKDPNKW